MPTTMQRKEYVTVPFEVKTIDSRKRQFEGYSATWELDLGNDVIHKGAFARTIDHWRQSNGRKSIPLVDSHQYTSIFHGLGRLTDAEEDDRGLKSQWEVIDGVDGERVMDRLRGGVIRKKSIGYRAVKADHGTVQRDGKEVKVRNLREIAWEETSLVLFPMNPGAEIDLHSVKSLFDALRVGTMTDAQKAELRALLNDAPTPDEAAEEVSGLAPDDPKRIALEAMARAVTLRSLATR